MYVFQEYIKNVDGVKTSLFFYKDAGGKIKAGPVWDCELAFGVEQIEDGVDMSDPCGEWITGSHLKINREDKYSIFSLLCRHNDFREEAQKQWEEHFLPNIDEVLQELEIMRSVNGVSIALDKCKWSEIGIRFQDSLDLFQKNVDDMKKFLKQDLKLSGIIEYLDSDECKKLRDWLNDAVHLNYYNMVLLNDGSLCIDPKRKATLDEVKRAFDQITMFHVACVLCLKPVYMMSHDYIDYKDCGMEPPEGCEYDVSPFVQEYLEKTMYKICPKWAEKVVIETSPMRLNAVTAKLTSNN
jgi:hypothetical protein